MGRSAAKRNVNTASFRALSFKEQLSLLKLQFTDPDRYKDLFGIPPRELMRLQEDLEQIHRLTTRPTPDVDFSVTFSDEVWTAYLTRYSEDTWLKDLPEFEYKSLLGIPIFNFPLISMDRESYLILKWLRDHPEVCMRYSDLYFQVLRLRTAYELMLDPKPNLKKEVEEVYQEASQFLTMHQEVESLINEYPLLVEPSHLSMRLEIEEFSMLFNQAKTYNHRFYFPLIPSDLFEDAHFRVTAWDFLFDTKTTGVTP